MDTTEASIPDEPNEDTFDSNEVVLRKGSRQCQAAIELQRRQEEEEKEGLKRVKWSESTDLRERMKEYRRSQLDICLDYQHIAIEEEREREGVKKWRTKLKTESDDENEPEDQKDSGNDSSDVAVVDDDVKEDDGATSDSDDEVTCCDEALEDRLRIIKARSSRITLQPAYAAAAQTYQEWLSSSDNISHVTAEQLAKMTSQLDLYKQILDLLNGINDSDATETIDASYAQVTTKITEAKQLGEPPEPVSKIMNAELTKKENVDKQMQIYNSLVNEMVVAFSSGVMI